MKKPVLLKRGMAATINDLLLSAEYILAEGNEHVILCERGVRSFDPAARNMFDLTAIPIVQRLSHLPIIADPSHGTGLRDKVIPMARAAVAAGADGVIVEVHPEPDRALSDGAQSLYPDQFAQLVGELRAVAAAIGRNILRSEQERHKLCRVRQHYEKDYLLRHGRGRGLAVALAAVPTAARAQSADAVMDRAVAAYSRLNTMRAGFTQTLTNPLTGSTQTTTGVILRKKPNLLSINFDSGDRVTADGSALWIYLPSSTPGQVMRMPSKGASADAMDPAGEFLDSPRTRFNGNVLAAPRRSAAAPLMQSRWSRSAPNPNFTSAKVWIDDADSSIRQFDIETANGLKRHVVITSFTANPALSRASFRFNVPKGAKIVDQASGAF